MCQPVEVRLPEPPTPPSPSTCCLQPVETFFPKKEALPVRSEKKHKRKKRSNWVGEKGWRMKKKNNQEREP
jgi:hypothetical protein